MYELFQSEKTQKYHFRLKARNGEIILTSQAYADKRGAMNGIESVRKNGASESSFEIKTSSNGRDYFCLIAKNKQVIGQSQMYKTKSGLKNGIQSVGRNCDAEVKDLTA